MSLACSVKEKLLSFGIKSSLEMNSGPLPFNIEKKGGDNKERLIRFFKEEDGLESVEYALLAVLIALGIIVGVTTLSGWINTTFDTVANTTPSGPATP